MNAQATRDRLGIFWQGEEGDGILVYGYWKSSSATEPEFPRDVWNAYVDWRPRRLAGADWTVWMWEIRINQWPPSTRWHDMIQVLLAAMQSGGSAVSWCGLEGFFVDPPGLLSPAKMSGGAWAAMAADGTSYGPPPLEGPFDPLSDDVLNKLHRLALRP